MKIEKNVKKSVKIALIFLAIGLVLGTIIVFAATPSSTFYISSGAYPGAPSYTIWKEGSNYFAKDANGLIAYSGTNFSDVMQNCIDNGGEGLHIYLREGQYVATNKIQIDRRITISGAGSGATTTCQDGMTVIYLDDAFPDECLFELIESTGLTNTWWQIPIFEKIMFYGNEPNQAHQVNCFQEVGSSAIDLQFRLLWFDDWNGHAINLTFSGQHRIDTCWFEHHNPIYAAITTDVNEVFYVNVVNCYSHAPLFINNDAPYVVGWHFSGNTIIGDDGGAAACALSLNYSLACKVNGNFFRNLTAQIGIDVSGTTKNCMITNNMFGDGFYATGDVAEPIHGTPNGTEMSLIRDNMGYTTEYSGLIEASNDDWIFHGLAYTPTSIVITVNTADARYIVQVKDVNSTHFQIYLWDDTAGVLETVDKTIGWYAEYKPA